ncbi:DUF721 domain-containing protein [Luteimonas aquatica]|uniref:DUF721 domain-containing protein n=1 Tax=Luteimonas aquatica TaxID=450364 RepID=UPI001F57D4B9|nr:DUF721 domain-containing protein [Luteimonas aquatica]
MSDSRSRPPDRSAVPRAALDALLAEPAGDPLRRALWLDELDRRLRPLLAPPLAAHARLANVDGAKLVFVTDSPVWHAKLRLAADTLLDAARSIGLDVSKVTVKTATRSSAPPAQGPRPAKPMSAHAREALREALASLRESGGGPAKDES